MGGLFLLLVLCAVMAFASFLAGALPLSMSLTNSQLRLISSIGVGILVGTSLIVIIPEGVEAIANPLLNPPNGVAAASVHVHRARRLASPTYRIGTIGITADAPAAILAHRTDDDNADSTASHIEDILQTRAADDAPSTKGPSRPDLAAAPADPKPKPPTDADGEQQSLPTFFIGFALITGFVLMFLIDRLPRHVVDELQSAPATRHISLDNLASSSIGGDDSAEEEGFLGSLAPTPRQSRGLATTVGLVIHAAADGIAMGASATTEDMKLGLVIFVAIMVHKAPAAFGLTSVLLKHGLSKRAARGHLVVFSLAAPFGALATYIIIRVLGGGNMEGERGQWWTGMLLLFSAGTFLYVAMQAMQEEHGAQDHHSLGSGYADAATVAAQRKQSRPQMRDTLATIAGMLLPLLTQFGHHH